jgi:GT2 family glycosyltransferase
MSASDLPTIGVAVVTFNAHDVILDCLESLMAAKATGARLHIVVIDNASADNTVDVIRSWANGSAPYQNPGDIPFELPTCPKPCTLVERQQGEAVSLADGGDVTLIHADANAGFASGVNIGLAALAAMPEIDLFWVMNPDSVTLPGTPSAYAAYAAQNPGFGLMGGRTCYMDPPDQIQIDGGLVNEWSGVTGNIGLGASHKATKPPTADQIDFITGANVIASRAFYEQIGPMPEDYFLYYEEVDWAYRGKSMPLIYCPDALIHHRSGTSIGSPTLERIASPFSMYFKYRSRMMFVRRYKPIALPYAYAYASAKAAQIMLKGARPEAMAILAAINGRKPPRDVAAKLSPAAQKAAFGNSFETIS